MLCTGNCRWQPCGTMTKRGMKRGEARGVASNTPIMAGVAGRYASALLETANEQNDLANVEKDIDNIARLLDESEDFQRMVRSPVFTAEDQTKALDAILGKIGVSKLTSNFFNLLVRNRRLFAAPDMIRAFQSLAAAARGEVQAHVASAVALSEAQISALGETLKAAEGREVKIETKVDPSLLGGLVVKIGSRMIDSSLKTKIATLNMRMKEVG